MYFFLPFLWRSFRFSLLEPSIKKNYLPVPNLYYKMDFMFIIRCPGEQESPSRNTISMEGTWKRGRSEKSLQGLISRGQEGGKAL